MCGIAGIIAPDANEATIATMLALMEHRGPDDEGWHLDDGVALGNRRLSIFDLSPAGHQPMSNHDGSLWIVHNGEIYNHIELRRELNHYPFTSRTDSEVILAAYEAWGEECLERFNGMFAFAIWDSRSCRLFCARDRIGIKPFYYHMTGDRLLFASEIKALLGVGVPRRPNDRVIHDYLVDGYYDHTDETFCDGIYQLPAGHKLVYHDGRLVISPYWQLAERVQNLAGLSDAEYAECYLALLRDAVRLRLRGDVPYGVYLSGGLDSSSIAVLADELKDSTAPLRTFTLCFEDQRYNEQPFAAEVLRGKDWQATFVLETEAHAGQLLERTVWHQEQPFAGVMTMGDLLLNKAARENGVLIVLEGQGADECLAGYEYFFGAYLRDLLNSGQETIALAEAQAYCDLRGLPANQAKDVLQRLVALDRDKTGLAQDNTRPTNPSALNPDLLHSAGTDVGFAEPFARHLLNRTYRDLRHTKLPRILRFKDRASMAYGVELRVPFLDHRLVEYSFSMPADQKIRAGVQKALLRRVMQEQIPEINRDHVKRQVQTPQREWLSTTLRPVINDLIHSASFRQRPYFDVARVQAEFDRYCQDPDRYGNSFFIWQWFSLEKWFQMFIDDLIVQPTDLRVQAKAAKYLSPPPHPTSL